MNCLVLFTISTVLLLMLIATWYVMSVQKISYEEAIALSSIGERLLNKSKNGYICYPNYIFEVNHK